MCVVCDKFSDPMPWKLFCDSCRLRLLSLESFSAQTHLAFVPISIFSLYPYSNLVRKLILEAKLFGNLKVAEYLRQRWINCLLNNEFLKNYDEVVVASASLKSRLYGRFDLAYFLASSLATHLDLPLKKAPLRFEWAKQAYRSRSDRLKESRKIWQNIDLYVDKQKPRRILVDDVSTSASTLAQLIKKFPASRYQIVVLAAVGLQAKTDVQFSP